MENDRTYRVVRLLVENYKRLQAVDVTPPRNAVVVTGKNRAGKSSLLDAIAAALGGKKQMAAKPLREGAEDGQIVCVLGDTKPELLVKRVFDASGKTALEITSAEGYKAPTPQAILDGLCSSIAFDPLSFTRMDDRKQLETLRSLVGVDFSEYDKKRALLYAERTAANKEATSYATQAAGVVCPAGTPNSEVSISDLMAEHTRRLNHNKDNARERTKLDDLKKNVYYYERHLANVSAEIADLEARLKAAYDSREIRQREHDELLNVLSAQNATVDVLEDQDIQEVQDQILAAQTVNANVGKRKRKVELEQAASAAKTKADALTAQIDLIDQAKVDTLTSVKWPIEGLSFGDGGVLYRGLPFSQASSAEQLSVSFAMATAMHPRLRVALIRDASLLDEEQMAAVCALAEKHDTQVWLEVVNDKAGPCGILIEDGMVAQPKEESVEWTTSEEKTSGGQTN